MVRLPLSVLLLAFFVIGCGGGPSTDPGQTSLVGPTVPLCGNGSDPGQQASDSMLNSSKIGGLAFGQTFNMAWFSAVSKTSRSETLRFLRLQGVRVSKVLEGDCDNYPSAPVVVGEDAALWSRALAMIPQGGVLLGLYPGRERIKGTQVVSADYALILRRDASRHTLLHEMAHYLLHRQRLDQGVGNAAFDREFQTALRAVEQAKLQAQKNPSLDSTVYLANQWTAAFPYFVEDQRRSRLEEAGIEDFIGRSFVAKDILHIPREDALSIWYLKHNLDASRSYFEARELEANRLLESLDEWQGPAVKDAIFDVINARIEIRDQLDQIQQILTAAEVRSKVASILSLGDGPRDLHPHQHGAGCSRHYDDTLQEPLF